jgi:GPH family glycoside/pentoside/hexuronide:cation symporter
MGLTIGGAAAGWMLAAFGFVANQEQTPEALMGIRVMFCIIPGALALLNGIILLFYPLSTARTEQMYRELKAIRGTEDSPGE